MGRTNFLSFDRNIVTGNTAATDGGGLYLELDAGTADLVFSQFTGNGADNGAGICLAGKTGASTGGTVNMVDDRLFQNTARTDGGGLYMESNIIANLFRDNTEWNSAGTAGGGIFNAGGLLRLRDSIVLNNTGPTDPNISGSYTDRGGNRTR